MLATTFRVLALLNSIWPAGSCQGQQQHLQGRGSPPISPAAQIGWRSWVGCLTTVRLMGSWQVLGRLTARAGICRSGGPGAVAAAGGREAGHLKGLGDLKRHGCI